MPDIHLKFANLLTSGSSTLLDRYDAVARHALDSSADAARLTLHYLQDLSQINMNALLQRVQDKGVANLYEFDPGSLKALCTLNDDYRSNLFAILLDMQKSMVESSYSSVYDGYRQWQRTVPSQ